MEQIGKETKDNKKKEKRRVDDAAAGSGSANTSVQLVRALFFHSLCVLFACCKHIVVGITHAVLGIPQLVTTAYYGATSAPAVPLPNSFRFSLSFRLAYSPPLNSLLFSYFILRIF